MEQALNDSINGGLYAQQTSDGGYIISGYIVTDYSDSLGEFTIDIYVIKMILMVMYIVVKTLIQQIHL